MAGLAWSKTEYLCHRVPLELDLRWLRRRTHGPDIVYDPPRTKLQPGICLRTETMVDVMADGACAHAGRFQCPDRDDPCADSTR